MSKSRKYRKFAKIQFLTSLGWNLQKSMRIDDGICLSNISYSHRGYIFTGIEPYPYDIRFKNAIGEVMTFDTWKQVGQYIDVVKNLRTETID